MEDILIRYLHFIAILTLASVLVVEHLLLKAEMSAVEIKRIAIIDMIYGISAGVILITGLLLWLWVGKPTEFYSQNPIFHIKLTLFLTIGLLSIYPTVFFLKNRRTNTEVLAIPKAIIMIIRVELLLLLLIPLLAVLMAQGIGLSQ